MKRFVTSLLAPQLVLMAAPHFARGADQASIDAQIESIRQEYGVQVHYRYDPALYFSKEWLSKPISANAAQIDLPQVERVIPLIRQFLNSNPKPVIQRNLKDIYLVSRQEYFGKTFGGTNSASAIYLASSDESRYTKKYLREGMHHEFSSILMRKYQFPKAAWNLVNPPGFSYGKSGVEALGEKGLLKQDDELLAQGFLAKYCESTMENDFNVVSAWLFVEPDKLKSYADKYEKIAAKRQLSIDFYKSIDKNYKF